eukprot:scaffold10209_cov116-Skeletonema_dohrnii-CCMP3373.AAC.1
MTAASDSSSLCPDGVWMTEEDAIKHLSLTKKQMRLFKNEACPMNMHFEHGRYVHAPTPYSQFQFVYISPENTAPLFGDITLINWSRMCDYFSNNIQTDDDVDMSYRRHFTDYTTLPATPANITAAFDAGVLKHSSQLQNVAPKKRGRPSKSKNTTNNQTGQKKKRVNTVENLLPKADTLTQLVMDRFNQLQPEEESSDKDLCKLGGLMKLAEIDSLTFQANRKKATKPTLVNIVFTVCCQCGCHRINEERKNQSPYCRKCTQKMSRKRIKKRQEEHAQMRESLGYSIVKATSTSTKKNNCRYNTQAFQQCIGHATAL